MKKFITFIGIILLLGGILLSYLYLTYPQTSLLSSTRYFMENLFIPHAKLNKHILGFMPFWQLDSADYIKVDRLSEINYFSITADAEGHIIEETSEPGWRDWKQQSTQDLLTEARIKGTDFTVTIAILDNITIESILSSEANQTTLISQIIQLIQKNHLDGINIDFEYFGEPDDATKSQFTDFSKQLSTALEEQTPTATLSLSIMPRAARDPGIFDFKQLASLYDRFIGMSYEYYTGENEFSAPVAPMSGYKDNKYFFDIETTYEDYVAVLPKEKIIMGIPYYGWERAVEDGPTLNSSTFPSDASENYSAVMSYGRARESKEIIPDQCSWDDYALEQWCWYTDKESGVDRQAWIANNKSIGIRYEFAKQHNLGGIAIWTLGYDKDYPDLWDMISTKFVKK